MTFFDILLILALGAALWLAWRARRENRQLRDALARASEEAARGYVLENGTTVLSGRADDLAVNPAVRHAYLGE